MAAGRTFAHWSPLQLAHAIGFRVDLGQGAPGARNIDLIRPDGRRFPLGHDSAERAHRLLSRIADARGIDATRPPMNAPRALLCGVPQ